MKFKYPEHKQDWEIIRDTLIELQYKLEEDFEEHYVNSEWYTSKRIIALQWAIKLINESLEEYD